MNESQEQFYNYDLDKKKIEKKLLSDPTLISKWTKKIWKSFQNATFARKFVNGKCWKIMN
jgi:hypothetical protein